MGGIKIKKLTDKKAWVANYLKFINMAGKFPSREVGERIIYRNSESGRITTKEYAEKHPKTTEKERIKGQ